MTESLRQHIIQGLDKNIRLDGRKKDDYRKVWIEYNVSNSAEGSARVHCGPTDILAGVKMGIEKPYDDTPDRGNLMVNAELIPMSNPEFEVGPPSDWSIEVARITDRGIRESKALEQKTLCIKAGESVWSVMVDVIPVNDAGNLLDMAGLGALAALGVSKYPGKKENGKVDYEKHTDKKLQLACKPIPVTVWKIGKHLVVDPLTEEEKVAEARLTITTIEDGTIVALQKGGETPLTVEEIDEMVGMAIGVAKTLRALLE
jgi:exosome complex component RRP42